MVDRDRCIVPRSERAQLKKMELEMGGERYSHITSAMQERANKRGYWLAEEVLGPRRMPTYDYDNIAAETRRRYGIPDPLPLTKEKPESDSIPKVSASRKTIQKALNRLR